MRRALIAIFLLGTGSWAMDAAAITLEVPVDLSNIEYRTRQYGKLSCWIFQSTQVPRPTYFRSGPSRSLNYQKAGSGKACFALTGPNFKKTVAVNMFAGYVGMTQAPFQSYACRLSLVANRRACGYNSHYVAEEPRPRHHDSSLRVVGRYMNIAVSGRLR